MRTHLALAALLLSFASNEAAQAQSRVKRIGILYQDSGILFQIDAFRETLRGFGYIEGKGISYKYSSGHDDLQRAADELVRSNVDLIVTPGTTVWRPNVLLPRYRSCSTARIRWGRSSSRLGRPGSNVTGVALGRS